MSLPRKDFDGQECEVTMMELRASPGDVIDRVTYGMIVHTTKNGNRVATIAPVSSGKIAADGSFVGEKPLTMGHNLSSHYE